MKIYKIRAWVNKHITRGRNAGTTEQEYCNDVIVIDNLETAKSVFASEKNRVNADAYYAGYSGKVELFEPHIFEDGTIAYWPDEEIYIDLFETT